MTEHDWRANRARWTAQYVCRRCGTVDGPARWLRWLAGRDECDLKARIHRIRRGAYVVKGESTRPGRPKGHA